MMQHPEFYTCDHMLDGIDGRKRTTFVTFTTGINNIHDGGLNWYWRDLDAKKKKNIS